MQIPRTLAHIWIGPLQPPAAEMRTWRDLNPDWSYRLYDNDFLRGRRWRNQPLIDEYLKRAEYAGVADLMRYEILDECGGLIAEADSICERPVAPLFESGALFTVYENEFVRGELVSPILAATPGHPFVRALVDELGRLRPEMLREPWRSTGNYFVARMIRALKPEITIFPSYTFIPEHYTGEVYDGPGPIYARQLFGSTRKAYPAVGFLGRYRERRKRKYRIRQTRGMT
jgi:mannosyltransferase OCH1-like enzyme